MKRATDINGFDIFGGVLMIIGLSILLIALTFVPNKKYEDVKKNEPFVKVELLNFEADKNEYGLFTTKFYNTYFIVYKVNDTIKRNEFYDTDYYHEIRLQFKYKNIKYFLIRQSIINYGYISKSDIQFIKD